MVYCIYTTDLSASTGKGAGVKFRNRKQYECSCFDVILFTPTPHTILCKCRFTYTLMISTLMISLIDR